MTINRDTLFYGSFAKEAGNMGCKLFNFSFSYHGLNAIYKSFSVNNIKDAVFSAKTLNMNGFAVTMPFKTEILNYVDKKTESVEKIGAANTVINKDGQLEAHNTDYFAAETILKNLEDDYLYILGKGGYSKAVQYAAKILNIPHETVTRKNWNDIKHIKNSTIYNCTPVENIKYDKSNQFIDCVLTSTTGKKLALLQASRQFELYTGLEFPMTNE
tara:strand:- start:17 stop:661 length:645 start_codon:yes stop_codon:yes gene_type:complete